MATSPTRQLIPSATTQQITTPPKPVTSPPTGAAPQPPVLRYKTINAKYRAQLAPEGSDLANALKRVPPRVKALGGVIVEDFIEIARLCDKLEAKVALLEKQLDDKTKSSEYLNERLEEGRTNFDLLVTRFTNSVEQATQLRKQVDEERVDTEQRHNMAMKQEKLLRDQVAALRRQVDGERMMATHYKKEQALLKASVADMEKELATFRTNSTLTGTPEPKSRKDHQRKEEIKKLTSEVADMKADLTGAMESRRLLEQDLVQTKEREEKREQEYQDLLRKFEASTRVLERTQERLANANEYLEVNDSLAADDALARMISFNEEVTQIASLLSGRVTFLQEGEDELPNPYAEEEEPADLDDGRGKDMIHRFLSARFPQLLTHEDIEKRRAFLDLAIRACLVFFAGAIINSGCFGLREDLDQFFLQVWGIVQSDNAQPIANRWRALTHHSIRSSPAFPVNRTLVPSMIKSLTSIFRMARVLQPEQTAQNFVDDLSSIHASALALEIDYKERVVSTNYAARVAGVDSPFLAVEMLDVSVFMEGLRDVVSPTHLKAGVKTVLACVSLGLSASGVAAGRTRKSMSGKMKNEIRLEPTVLLDAVLP